MKAWQKENLCRQRLHGSGLPSRALLRTPSGRRTSRMSLPHRLSTWLTFQSTCPRWDPSSTTRAFASDVVFSRKGAAATGDRASSVISTMRSGNGRRKRKTKTRRSRMATQRTILVRKGATSRQAFHIQALLMVGRRSRKRSGTLREAVTEATLVGATKSLVSHI